MAAAAALVAMLPATAAPLAAEGAEMALEMRLADNAQARMDLEHELRAEAGAATPLPGSGTMGGSERIVKGAPYCAEAVHETVQWLPEPGGAAPNRIVRQSTTRLCRDSEGRTRQEVERGERRLVYLRDPVAREAWVLDPQRKSARRLAGGSMPLEAAADAALWRDYAEQVREWARGFAEATRSRAGAHGAGAAAGSLPGGPLSPPLPPLPPSPSVPPVPPVPPAPTSPALPSAAAVPALPGAAPAPPAAPSATAAVAGQAAPAVITRIERAGPRETEVTVMRMGRSGDPGLGEWPAPPPAVQWHATRLAPRGPGVTTALPSREFEGVRAHGEQTTWVIEAGRVGNERPIQIVREVWTAPELLLTISSREFDPRTGEVNYRLKNLKRGEPQAELMRVPADYTRPGRGGSGASAPRG